MPKTRQPIQTRSIETKRKIVSAGYELFAKQGFYKTNTAMIAKYAGVSTGIVYGYFNNKTDILKEVINEYVEKTYSPVFELIDNIATRQNLKDIAFEVLALAEKLHVQSCDMHRELGAVSQADKQVNEIFVELQDIVTMKFVEKLKSLKYKNITCEKVHLAMNIIESFVHEVVYDNHAYINYDKLKNDVVLLLITLFEK
ncbi:MAG: TetR/AcrR family transcriptional regulator [Clostridia bacterium]|nr:TetR/AcrR family transcriptional regulator [Clostridia bacterium]